MIGSLLNNRYEIIEKIGGGGMAEVYKAKCKILKRFVAIKVLREQFVDDEEVLRSFEKEAESAAILSSSNIVGIYDVGMEEDIHYIVMEYIDGITLKQYVKEKGKLEEREAVTISLDIAEALRVAHSNGIVHRDIKPQNIMITKDKRVKVTDFGIAKAATSSTINSGNDILGSAHYLSPEQARGGFTDFKSDIYSLGVVMYEMITGAPPFIGETPIAVAIKHLQEEPLPPSNATPEISKGFESVILKAMSKDQSLRYSNSDELSMDLRDILRMSPVGNEDDQFRTQKLPMVEKGAKQKKNPNKKNKSKKTTMVAIILALILVLVGSSIYLANNGVFDEKKAEIPNLIGLTEEEAKETLDELKFDLEVKIKSKEFNNEVKKGKIIKHDPKKGDKVSKGETIDIVISKGKKGIKVPDLIGKTLEEAKLEIEDSKFKIGEISYEESDEKPGMVIKQTPNANRKRKAGDEIKLVISKAKVVKVETRIVPNLIGMSASGAKDKIVNNGLAVGQISEEFSDKESGTVIRQGVNSGTTVNKGSTLSFTISKGKEPEPEPEPEPKTDTETKSDTETPQEKTPPETVENKTQTIPVSINLPQDKETAQVVIKKHQNGRTSEEYNNTVETSRKALNLQITAQGTGTVRIEGLVDGVIVFSKEVTL